MLKCVLYIIILPFVIWCMEGIDFNRLFKQGRVIQARFIYLLFAMSISYLVVNFMYDFFINCQIIK